MCAKRFDSKKLRFDLIPVSSLEAAAEVFAFGAQKYGDRNWTKGMEWTRMLGSLERHLHAIKQGEDIDKESGLKHIGHLLCNAMMLADYYQNNVRFDNRARPKTRINVRGLQNIGLLDPERTSLITNDMTEWRYYTKEYPKFDVWLTGDSLEETIPSTCQMVKQKDQFLDEA